MTNQQHYQEWRNTIIHSYHKISETPRAFEWRSERRVSGFGNTYTSHTLYADIDMQWRKGGRIQRGWQATAGYTEEIAQ